MWWLDWDDKEHGFESLFTKNKYLIFAKLFLISIVHIAICIICTCPNHGGIRIHDLQIPPKMDWPLDHTSDVGMFGRVS